MSSRIEQIIEEIEEYIDKDCKFQPLSSTKIIVNKEHLDELLRELRMKTPDEIKRYQKIISNRDAILADAKAKADAMIEEAQVQTTELVSEHEIMQQAYAQANEIVTQATAQAQEIIDNATMDANEIRMGAIQYTDDLLANAESIIGHTLDSYTTKYDGLINSLQECYDAVSYTHLLADGYEGALELTEEIVQDVYQKTNDVRLREFILNNQKQSGEGSV